MDLFLVKFLQPVLSNATFGTDADLAPRFVLTVSDLLFRPLLLCLRGFASCFAAFLSGWSRFHSYSSVSRVRCLSCSFAAWLKGRSSLLLLITNCTYCSLELWLVFVSKTQASFSWYPVDACIFVQNFRICVDCCSVSDDLSPAVRLEECHRSSVCTRLHRLDRPRCIGHLEVHSWFTFIDCCELPRIVVLQRFTKHTKQRQLLLKFHHSNNGCNIIRASRNN